MERGSVAGGGGMMRVTGLDRIRGCLIGGAVGDALGYSVEFRSARDIFAIYGSQGICHYELFGGKALISDDTQMTLFTACGLLQEYTRLCLRGIMGPWQSYVNLAYKDWLATQDRDFADKNPYGKSWLLNYREFFNNRAPGNTCLSALKMDECGSVAKRINNSKGCGGVMRVAPVGLYLVKHMRSLEEVAMVGAEVAALTHGHPLGYIPASALAYIIAGCLAFQDSLEEIVAEAVNTTCKLFQAEKHTEEFKVLMERAVELSKADTGDLDAIRMLGEGWVAEEALAIAVYSALKYQDDFAQGIICAVNHDGDSDSTGAITGNILGAYLGISAIPQEYVSPLELLDVMEELANDMYEDCKMEEYSSYHDEKWWQKYGTGTYYGRE